jgi:tetratricopeptide (TPR) repeat protein
MKSISKLKDDARKHEQREEWEKAIQVYLQVLRTSEDGDGEVELPLYNRIGDLCLRLGRPQEAVKHYEQAADRYADAGLYNNAIALCNKALRYNPDRLDLVRKLGQFSASQGFVIDARRYFLEYAEKKFKAGAVDEALTALEDFAELSDDPEIRELLGRRLHVHGRNREAVEELRKAHAMYTEAGNQAKADGIAAEISAIDPDAVLPDNAEIARAGRARDASRSAESSLLDRGSDELPGLAEFEFQSEASAEAAPEIVSSDAAQIDEVQVDTNDLGDFDDDAAQGGSLLEGFEGTQLVGDDVLHELGELELPDFEATSDAPDAVDASGVEIEGLEATALDFGAATQDLDGSAFELDIVHDETSFDESVTAGDDDESFLLPTLDTDDEESTADDGAFELPMLADDDEIPPDELTPLVGLEESGELSIFGTIEEDPTSDFVQDPEANALPARASDPESATADDSPIDLPLLDQFDDGNIFTLPDFEDLAADGEADVADEPLDHTMLDAEAGLDTGDDIEPPALGDALPGLDQTMPEFILPSFGDQHDQEDGLDDESDEHGEQDEEVDRRPMGFTFESADTAETAEVDDIDDAFDAITGLDPVAPADDADPDDVYAAFVGLDASPGFEPIEAVGAVEPLEFLDPIAHAEPMEPMEAIDEGQSDEAVEPDEVIAPIEAIEPIGAGEPGVAEPGDGYDWIADSAPAADVESEPPVDAAAAAVAGAGDVPASLDSDDAMDAEPVEPVRLVPPDDGFIDLAALVADDEDDSTRFRVQESAPTGDEDRDFAELLSQFKAKVSAHLPTEDAAAHYDLGLAFKEMGLVDEAIAEFQIALRAGHMRLKVFEELGQCFLEKDQHNIAEKVLRRALEMNYDDELELLGVYYHLGRAYEGMGHPERARDAYERVLGMDINFGDVSDRLSRL